MAKIKLQNVPIEAQNEIPNLMGNEPDLLNDSGILSISGILDDSGEIPNNVEVRAGSQDIRVGVTPFTFILTISWESGLWTRPNPLYEEDSGVDYNQYDEVPNSSIPLKVEVKEWQWGNIEESQRYVYENGEELSYSWIGYMGVRITFTYHYKDMRDSNIHTQTELAGFTIPTSYIGEEEP